jgi:hypothetical protein
MTQRHAPATERNRAPILEVLQHHLPEDGAILEISSGTGQHASFFAPFFAPRQWLPSDVDDDNLTSIAAWRDASPADNLLAPARIDVGASDWWQRPWPVNQMINAIVNINMIHIAPWACCEGLLRGSEKLLTAGGVLYLYGPFKQGGQHTAASNEAFDTHLKNQNPLWGVRNLESVIELAAQHGLEHRATIEMPANNLSVIFIRR